MSYVYTRKISQTQRWRVKKAISLFSNDIRYPFSPSLCLGFCWSYTFPNRHFPAEESGEESNPINP